MKKAIFPLLAVLSLFIGSCNKSSKTSATSYTDAAVIKGPNMFTTTCGGAYWIVIDTANSRTTFDSLPAGCGIDLSTATFPVNVKLNWHYQSPNTCSIIVVDAIAKTN